MSRDYAKKSYASQKHKRQSAAPNSYAAVWLLVGLVFGLAIGSIFYFKNQGIDLLQHPFKMVLNKTQAKHAAKKNATAPEATQPRFDFYTVLPNTSVPTSGKAEHAKNPEHAQTQQRAEAVATPKTATATPTTTTATNSARYPLLKKAEPNNLSKNTRYVLQVASFKNLDEAEQLKAKLAFAGIVAKIKSAQNADPWNRVWVGTYASMQSAKQAQKDLKQQQINSVVVKVAS